MLGVVIPVLNDVRNMQRLLSKIQLIAPSAKMFVIDDLSHDGSREVALEYNAIVPYTFERRGLGRSYAEGIAMAVYEHGCEIVFIMDSDHPAEFLAPMLKKMYDENLDMVIGFERDTRTITSSVASAIVKDALGLYEFDQPTCGFMCFTAELIKRVELRKIKSHRDFYHVELLYRAKKAGAKIGQLEFTGHEHGSSSVKRVFDWLYDLVEVKFREVVDCLRRMLLPQ